MKEQAVPVPSINTILVGFVTSINTILVGFVTYVESIYSLTYIISIISEKARLTFVYLTDFFTISIPSQSHLQSHTCF